MSLGYAADEETVSFSGRIATQYQLRWHDYETDQDLAQYLALDAENLWKDKLDAAIYLRLWEDIDGRYKPQGNKSYYIYQGISDAYTRQVDNRIYYGYFVLKNIVGASQFRLGRQYLYEIEGIQFDGIKWSLEESNGLEVTAFFGQPVSYYSEMDGNRTYGGSLAYKFNPAIKLGLDYLKYSKDTLSDNYIALQMQNRFSDRWRIYSKYAFLDSDPRDFQIQTSYTNPESDWNLNATYYQQIKRLEQYSNQFSPYYAALSDYAPFHQLNLSLYKEFTPIIAGEAGFTKRQLQHSGEESEYNREYDLVYTTLIIRDIAVKGLELSITGQRWITARYTRTTSYYDDATATTPSTAIITMPSDSVTTFGSELKYRWQKKLTLNLGTDYSRYKYDYDTDSEKRK
ncbi:MAG: hypothetical protein QME64_11345 [bacterium]|nr:hypothetical protein [bacterium]